MKKQDEILIASYYALAWWAEALTQKYFQSPAFNLMPFKDEFVKSRLIEGNAPLALIMPSLYVALVIPRETLFTTYKHEFEEIDLHLQNNVKNFSSTYSCDQDGKVLFTRHIRNAVAHAEAEFTTTGVIFRDKNSRKNTEEFYAELSFDMLGYFVDALQKIILKRVVEIQKIQIESAD